VGAAIASSVTHRHNTVSLFSLIIVLQPQQQRELTQNTQTENDQLTARLRAARFGAAGDTER
jgi:hypothetical protein